MFETGTETFIILGTLLIFVFILGTILFIVVHQKRLVSFENKQNLKLSEAVIESQENERKNIRDDLHEQIGPLLSTIKMYLRTHISKSISIDKSDLQQAIELTDDCIKRIRDISHILRPVVLENSNLTDTVLDFCSVLNKTKACSIEFHHNLEGLNITQIKELMLFRIIQEFVLNAIKHSNADRFTISMNQDQELITVTIMHNGVKFDSQDYQKGLNNSSGLGLKNIQHRMILLNGVISFVSNEQSEGTGVHLKIPIN